ncbi:uncharacterized protein LOC132785950 [Drosophila nasuta]|uniref:uncharacterized protein LOC132785950 n=1 Tax=Drosophila nasuta TaxID=42062 RepID=UPI00295F054F|nr:uncharacterized protein LOC132785950 [Drosophila nasuta]
MLVSYFRTIFFFGLGVIFLSKQCCGLSLNYTEPQQIAELIESQSIGRIVNKPHHGNTASEIVDHRKDTVIFEEMNDISKSPDEHLPVTYIQTSDNYQQHIESNLPISEQYHYSSDSSRTTFNNILVTEKLEFVSNPTTTFHNVPDLHIHHHYHHVTLKTTPPPSVQYSTNDDSPEDINFQTSPDTIRPSFASPDLFNLLSQGNDVKNNLRANDTIDNKIPNISIITHFGQDDKTDRILDLMPVNNEDHTVNNTTSMDSNVSSTSSPFENDNSEYGVPLN